MSALAVKDLELSFGGLKALDRLSFEVGARQVTSVIGPNGAGKTSAFNCITGFYRATSGSVVLDGEDIAGAGPAGIAARGVARTFQNLRLFGALSAMDNVRAGTHLRTRQGVLDALLHTPRYRRTEQSCSDEARRWLRFVGLRQAGWSLPARDLAYGEQRLVEIARALACRPRMLLLDEPAAGLNHAETGQMADLVAAIQQLGITVVLIEHDMNLVMRVSDRVVVLNFGQSIASGTPEEVRENPAVIEAYLGGVSRA